MFIIDLDIEYMIYFIYMEKLESIYLYISWINDKVYTKNSKTR